MQGNQRRGPRGRWKWTPAVEETLTTLYGKVSPEEIAATLTRERGLPFSRAAVVQYATQTLGITTADAQGDLTISEAARELGIPIATLSAMMRRHDLPTKGTGRARFLTAETWRAVQAYYASPPEPVMTLQEAADRLRLSIDVTYNHVKTQQLKAYKHGGDWKVSRADCERFFWDLARQRRRGNQ